jgi:nickel/cobalt transporter (NicO) family protein
MNTEALFLVAAVAGVGVLHTIVPDHWVPITLIARQRGWSRSETATVAFKAGIGHVLSTLVLGLVVWIAGVAFATRFGHVVDTAASIALIGFGAWIAISALRELRGVHRHEHSHRHGHGHSHGHGHGHTHDFSHVIESAAATPHGVHGPELQRIVTGHGIIELSIFEAGVPPRFRLTGAEADMIRIETIRKGGARQMFPMVARGTYWESLAEIPEPHGFAVTVTVDHGGHAHTYRTAFAEHEHHHGEHDHTHGEEHSHGAEAANDVLYAAMPGGVAVLTHVHAHRHGSGEPHIHLHDHDSASSHQVAAETDAAPLHMHQHRSSSRTALMLILGSSPMVEGIPAFFAAGKYGAGVIVLMATIFALSTIATYVLLSVYSAAGLQRVKIGAFERYGEVLSGALIALVGVAFWIWQVV